MSAVETNTTIVYFPGSLRNGGSGNWGTIMIEGNKRDAPLVGGGRMRRDRKATRKSNSRRRERSAASKLAQVLAQCSLSGGSAWKEAGLGEGGV